MLWKAVDSNKMISKRRCALGILSVRVRLQLRRLCNLKALAEAGQRSARAERVPCREPSVPNVRGMDGDTDLQSWATFTSLPGP